MTAIKGDLLEVTEGIICHQVNCQRVAGKGLALQIRNKWPEWYNDFKTISPSLGKVWFYWPTDRLCVASLFAQDAYGKGLQTDYKALEMCLKNLNETNHAHYGWCNFYFPAGIGAGLGGGDSKIIHPLIEKYFPNAILVEKV